MYIAPSGVQKELMQASDLYVLSLAAQQAREGKKDRRQRVYLRSPPRLRPSQCTPLFLAAFERRGAACCIHTHSHWAVLVTLLLEARGPGRDREFRVNNLEQIKAFARSSGGGSLGYHDTLVVPVIENTAREEDLTEFLEAAIDRYPDTCAVLVRRHGVYVWGDSVQKAKTQCERCVALLLSTSLAWRQADVSPSLDYLFQLAVEMKRLGLPWISEVEEVLPTSQAAS